MSIPLMRCGPSAAGWSPLALGSKLTAFYTPENMVLSGGIVSRWNNHPTLDDNFDLDEVSTSPPIAMTGRWMEFGRYLIPICFGDPPVVIKPTEGALFAVLEPFSESNEVNDFVSACGFGPISWSTPNICIGSPNGNNKPGGLSGFVRNIGGGLGAWGDVANPVNGLFGQWYGIVGGGEPSRYWVSVNGDAVVDPADVTRDQVAMQSGWWADQINATDPFTNGLGIERIGCGGKVSARMTSGQWPHTDAQTWPCRIKYWGLTEALTTDERDKLILWCAEQAAEEQAAFWYPENNADDLYCWYRYRGMTDGNVSIERNSTITAWFGIEGVSSDYHLDSMLGTAPLHTNNDSTMWSALSLGPNALATQVAAGTPMMGSSGAMCAIVKMTILVDFYRVIIGVGQGDDEWKNICLVTDNADGDFRFGLNETHSAAGIGERWVGGPVLSADQWYAVVAGSVGGEYKLWVDGIEYAMTLEGGASASWDEGDWFTEADALGNDSDTVGLFTTPALAAVPPDYIFGLSGEIIEAGVVKASGDGDLAAIAAYLEMIRSNL